jgi:hypothetical protein
MLMGDLALKLDVLLGHWPFWRRCGQKIRLVPCGKRHPEWLSHAHAAQLAGDYVRLGAPSI